MIDRIKDAFAVLIGSKVAAAPGAHVLPVEIAVTAGEPGEIARQIGEFLTNRKPVVVLSEHGRPTREHRPGGQAPPPA